MIDVDKRLAAHAAADEVADGMLVGLGTGSTAAFLIARLGLRVREGLRITAVATSLATERAALAAGIEVRAVMHVAALDLAIDGVDEIDDGLRAIKGAGGAMLREKIVAQAARRMVAIADGSKRVDVLGTAPVPIEVLPFAKAFVEARLVDMGADVSVRLTGAKPYLTDQDNLVLDCMFSVIADPAALAAQLSAIPGLLGHGLFPIEIHTAFVAQDGLVTRLDRPS